MNYDQFTGILRAVVPWAVAILVSKVPILSGSADFIGSAALAAGAAIWSFFNNQSGKTIP